MIDQNTKRWKFSDSLLRVPCPPGCSHQHDPIVQVGWRWRHKGGRQRTESPGGFRSWHLLRCSKYINNSCKGKGRTLFLCIKISLCMVWKFSGFGGGGIGGGTSLALFGYWLSVLEICKQFNLELRLRSSVTYMGFIPLAEGGSINLDNSTLDKCVGSDKLVVRCIVNLCCL